MLIGAHRWKHLIILGISKFNFPAVTSSIFTIKVGIDSFPYVLNYGIQAKPSTPRRRNFASPNFPTFAVCPELSGFQTLLSPYLQAGLPQKRCQSKVACAALIETKYSIEFQHRDPFSRKNPFNVVNFVTSRMQTHVSPQLQAWFLPLFTLSETSFLRCKGWFKTR